MGSVGACVKPKNDEQHNKNCSLNLNTKPKIVEIASTT